MKRLATIFSLLAICFLLTTCQKEEPTENTNSIVGDWYLWNLKHQSFVDTILVSDYEIATGSATAVILAFEEGGFYEHNDASGVLNPVDQAHLFVGLDDFGGGSWQFKQHEAYIHFDAGVNELADFPSDLWQIVSLTEEELILEKDQTGEVFIPSLTIFFDGRMVSRMELRKVNQ